MRMRIWLLITLVAAVMAVAASGCAGGGIGRVPTMTPVPTKTLRPTFTHTPVKPTLAPAATEAPATPTPLPPTETPPPPTDTPAPPTATPAPQPRLTVTGATANVRSGPGTNYGRLGQVSRGQSFDITGRNQAGDWWQFDYNGRAGWISGSLVSTQEAAAVQVAADIPAPPTARPTTRPATRAPAQPTAPPAAPKLFVQAGFELLNADNTSFGVVTFWGRLGKFGESTGSGYVLRVTCPSGTGEKPFNAVWEWAYPGIDKLQFIYNVKLEMPRTGGEFRAVVIDGGGNEVSDPIVGTLLDRTHDVKLNWSAR